MTNDKTTVSFRTSQKRKYLMQALAMHLGFTDVSEMLNSLVDEKVRDTYSEDELRQLLRLIAPGDSSGDGERPKAEAEPHRATKAASGRR